MRTPSLACLLILLSCTAYTQEKIPGFGKIDPAELELRECAFEKGAAAMNLLRTATITMEANDFSGVPTLTTEYRVRIKIFNKRGFSAAKVQIPYASEGRSTKIKDIEAYIYSLDAGGKITRQKVEKREIFKDRSKAARSVNYVSFTFPDLNDGAVLEYRYTRIDKNSVRVQPWLFQDDIPTACSQVTTDIPAYAYLTYRIIGSDGVHKDSVFKKHYNVLYSENILSLTLRNIHSFRPEPLMYSLSDNLQRAEFSISPRSFLHSSFLSNESKMKMQNWALLQSRYFGYQCRAPIEGAGHLLDSVKKMARKEDRIAALYNYIRDSIEYNGERTFYCDSVEGCWKTRTGSSAEMNLLLLNLLRKAGIKCMPVLVSTHANGNPDPDFPSISQFNGVDVLVRDTALSYLVDCTQKHLSYRLPPYHALNSNAYVVDADMGGWIFIFDPRILMRTQVSIDAVMDTTGGLRGTAAITDIGFAKLATLEKAEKKENDASSDAPEDGPVSGLVVDTVATGTSAADTLVRKIGFHYLPSSTGNIYFVNPLLFFGFRKDPFRDSVRFSDVDFGSSQSFASRMRIKLAPNFSAEGLPETRTIQKDDSTISFTRKTFMEGNYLIIENAFVIKNAVYLREDYASLKSFFDKFYAFQNEDIPVKKDR